ncbi:MAG TPA: hypothetical protein GX709_03375 [Clostridiales bacterium]|nr:hypothetical protein [Clostridiales bacterium]
MEEKVKQNKIWPLVKFNFLTSLQINTNKRKKKAKDGTIYDPSFNSESLAKRLLKYYLGMILSFVYVAVMLALQGYMMGQVSMAQGIFAENLTFMLFALFLMSTMFGLLTYSNTMYYDKKEDFLSVLPITKDQIFWSKFIYLYIQSLPVTLILFLPLSFSSASGAKLGVGSYFILAIIPFFIPMLSLFVSTLVSLPINYIVSKAKRKELTKNIMLGILSMIMIAPVIALIIFLTGYSDGESQVEYMMRMQNSLQGAMQGVSYAIYPIYAFVKAATFAKGSGLMILYTIFIFVGITIITFVLSRLLYAKATTNLDDTASIKKVAKEGQEKSKAGILRKREEKRLLKIPGNSVSVITGTIVSFFVLIPTMIGEIQAVGGLSNMYKIAIDAGLTNTTSGAFMGICFFALSMSVVYTNIAFMIPISSEHRTGLDYLLSLPISLEEIIKAKFLTNLKFTFLLSLPVVIFYLFLSPILKLGTIFILVNGVLVALAMISLIYVVDMSKPSLDWTNVAEIRQKFRVNIPLMVGMLISMAQLPIVMPLALMTYEVLNSYLILYAVITIFNIIAFLIPFIILIKNYKKYMARLQA